MFMTISNCCDVALKKQRRICVR